MKKTRSQRGNRPRKEGFKIRVGTGRDAPQKPEEGRGSPAGWRKSKASGGAAPNHIQWTVGDEDGRVTGGWMAVKAWGRVGAVGRVARKGLKL